LLPQCHHHTTTSSSHIEALNFIPFFVYTYMMKYITIIYVIFAYILHDIAIQPAECRGNSQTGTVSSSPYIVKPDVRDMPPAWQQTCGSLPGIYRKVTKNFEEVTRQDIESENLGSEIVRMNVIQHTQGSELDVNIVSVDALAVNAFAVSFADTTGVHMIDLHDVKQSSMTELMEIIQHMCWHIQSPLVAKRLVTVSPLLSGVMSMTIARSTDHALEILYTIMNRMFGTISELESELSRLPHEAESRFSVPESVQSQSARIKHLQLVAVRSLFYKALFLTSATNDQAKLQSICSWSRIASVVGSDVFGRWYSAFLRSARGNQVHSNAAQNLKWAVSHAPSFASYWNKFDSSMCRSYFDASYIDANDDKIVRQLINSVIQKQHGIAAPDGIHSQDWIDDRADAKVRVAIVTSLWKPGHVVYRTTSRFVNALLADDRFEVDLLCTAELVPGMRDSLESLPKSKRFREIYEFHPIQALERRRSSSFDPESPLIDPIDIESEEDLEIANLVTEHCHHKRHYDIVFFPSVGISCAELILTNRRLAPIMATCPGQSVSSHGSLVDAYVSGSSVELPATPLNESRPEPAARFYSEQLIMIPGFGMVFDYSLFRDHLLFQTASIPDDHEELNRKIDNRARFSAHQKHLITKYGKADSSSVSPLFINVPLTAAKLNAHFVASIRRVIDMVRKADADVVATATKSESFAPLVLRFFPNIEAKTDAAALELRLHREIGAHTVPMQGTLSSTLWTSAARSAKRRGMTLEEFREAMDATQRNSASPRQRTVLVSVMPRLDPDSYLTELGQGDFAIEGYHFGGCNTVLDSIMLGVPIVAIEGDRWYNRVGSALLRKLGLADTLVTSSIDVFEKRLVSLITSDGELQAARSATRRVRRSLLTDAANHQFSTLGESVDKNHEQGFVTAMKLLADMAQSDAADEEEARSEPIRLE
jgi:hypothetical protein